MTSISDRVRALLESLGDTHDAVAESLRRRGIKGTREDGCDCPIARVIQAEFPEARKENGAVWNDEDGSWFVSSILVSTPDGKIRDALPNAVQDFIEIFDDGIGDDPYYNVERPYSDLEDR